MSRSHLDGIGTDFGVGPWNQFVDAEAGQPVSVALIPRAVRSRRGRIICFGVPPTSVWVFDATKPVDFRKGMDGLAAIVEGELKLEPFSGLIYVFRAKRAGRGKVLFWDGTGVCLLTKQRLEVSSAQYGRRNRDR